MTSGALPGTLALDPNTGAITGTPTVPGVYTFTLTATNGTRTAVQTLTYTVTPARLATKIGAITARPQLPRAHPPHRRQQDPDSCPDPDLHGHSRRRPGHRLCDPGGVHRRDGHRLPGAQPHEPDPRRGHHLCRDERRAAGTLALDPNTGAITGTPTVPGVYTFTLTATNGTRTAVQTLTYTITPAAALAIAYPTPVVFTAGTAIASQAPNLTNPTPGVATTYAVTTGSLPAGVTLDPNAGAITGTPTVPGVYTFTLTATNGTRTAVQTLTYTVTPAAALAIAYATPVVFTAGTAIASQAPNLTNPTPGVATTYAVTSGALPGPWRWTPIPAASPARPPSPVSTPSPSPPPTGPGRLSRP